MVIVNRQVERLRWEKDILETCDHPFIVFLMCTFQGRPSPAETFLLTTPQSISPTSRVPTRNPPARAFVRRRPLTLTLSFTSRPALLRVYLCRRLPIPFGVNRTSCLLPPRQTPKDERYLYLALEYIVGGEFYNLLRNTGNFDVKSCKFYTATVTSVFEYHHDQQVICRDLKPESESIMLTRAFARYQAVAI